MDGGQSWLSKGRHFEEFRKSTPEEIEEHLTKEARKKGFVGEARFVGLREVEPGEINNTMGSKPGKNVCGSMTKYRMETDTLYSWGMGCSVMYENGKWAELVPSITKAEAEKKLNCIIV